MNLALSEKNKGLIWSQLAFRIGFDETEKTPRIVKWFQRCFFRTLPRNVGEMIPNSDEHMFQLGWFNHYLDSFFCSLHLEVALSTLGLSAENNEEKGRGFTQEISNKVHG